MIENSLVCEKIIKLLKENSVAFELYEHEPVWTSEQAAKIRNAEMRQGAKAIVFSADNSPILIVVPGDKKVDAKTFKNLYNIKNLRLLTADEVKELTNLEIGAIPPFGSTMNLPTYLDQGIVNNKLMVFNAGAHTKSIQMKTKDFLSLENPIINRFSI